MFNDVPVTSEEKKEFEKTYGTFFSLLKKSNSNNSTNLISNKIDRPQSSRILNNDDKRKSIVNKPGTLFFIF